MRKEFEKALKRAGELKELTRKELVTLLSANEEEMKYLFKLADNFRSRFMGDEVYLRGIIEFSNYCSKNCLYCGLRRDNLKLARYRMKPEEIYKSASKATELGCKTIVLQSGEDAFYTAEIMVEIISNIKKLDVAVTLSIGDRTREDYALFKEAGADRYLLKHETCDAHLFAKLRPGTSLEKRLERLKWLRDLGYQVGSGNIVGLPGQTLESLAEDIILMRDLSIDMAGIGPFVPNKQTPLGNCQSGSLEMTLKTLAVSRLTMPFVHLPATTAVNTIDPLGRVKALKCGSNVIMPNMTPLKYRVNYRLYPGKYGLEDSPEKSYLKAVAIIENAGRRVGRSYGHSLKKDFIPPKGINTEENK